MDLAERYAVVREALQDRRELSTGTVTKLVDTIRREVH
jgi:hypothetical protein